MRIAGKPPIDWAGQALVVLTLFSLTGAFIETGSSGWTSLPVIGGLILAVLAGSLFLLVEMLNAKGRPEAAFQDRWSDAAIAGRLAPADAVSSA